MTLNNAVGLSIVDGHFFQEASGFRHISNGSNGDCIDRNQAHGFPQLLTHPDLLLNKKKKNPLSEIKGFILNNIAWTSLPKLYKFSVF